MNVGELREKLAEFPDFYLVEVADDLCTCAGDVTEVRSTYGCTAQIKTELEHEAEACEFLLKAYEDVLEEECDHDFG